MNSVVSARRQDSRIASVSQASISGPRSAPSALACVFAFHFASVVKTIRVIGYPLRTDCVRMLNQAKLLSA
jgi:hypothetical protein